MKRNYIMIMAAICAAAVSCTEEKSVPQEPALHYSEVVFVCDSPSSKITIGEKSGSGYPCLWEEGDALDVYRVSDGVLLGTAEIQPEYVGKTSGKFNFRTTPENSDNVSVRLIYPAGAPYGKNIAVETEQTRQSSSDKGFSSLTYAYSDALMTSTSVPVEFELYHSVAMVKLSLSTKDLQDKQISSVSMSCPGAGLSGLFLPDYNKGEKISSTKDSVRVTLSTPAPLSSEATCYLAALPCNLSGKDVYVNTYLTTGEKVVSVLNGGKLLANALNIIEITNLSDKIDAPWFIPAAEDGREMLDGWAYGPQNTYFVEKKLQSAYSSRLVIDVRARGDYYKCKEPVYYGILTSSNIEGRPFLSIEGNTEYSSRPSYKVSDSYTISVDALSSDTYSATGTWGTVGIYDARYNLLWSYMIIGSYDTDPVEDVDYGSFKMMDRALGASYSSGWLLENKASEEACKAHDEYAAYFQWGRKDPFMWNPTRAYSSAPASPEVSVASAISHPTIYYTNESSKSWSASNPNYRLWGFDGKKTIYDPCPAGYKVPDKSAIEYVAGNMTPDDGGSPAGTAVNLAVKNMAVTLPSGGTDYWPYVGCLWGLNSGTWTTRTKAQDSGPLYWGNQISSGNGFCLYGFFNGKGAWVAGPTSNQNAKLGFAVRCMKE